MRSRRRWLGVPLVLVPWLGLAQEPASPALSAGPKAGERLPPFELPDQNGTPRSFDSLKREQGLVLVFFRSADW